MHVNNTKIITLYESYQASKLESLLVPSKILILKIFYPTILEDQIIIFQSLAMTIRDENLDSSSL